MIWICPRCNHELGELNGWCEYCKVYDNTIVYNPDKYYIRDIRVNHIADGDKPMTPQEELFAQLFNHEKILVKDMDTLTLRSHREELAKIAFEARARLTAVDDEEKSRRKLSGDGKPSGFERSVNTDENTTNAINTIKERQKRLTKADKVRAGLIELFKQSGMSHADAEKEAMQRMTAGSILNKLKENDDKSKDILLENQTRSPLSQQNGFVINHKIENKPKEESKPLINPFEKK